MKRPVIASKELSKQLFTIQLNSDILDVFG